jgi:kynurenine formamidase
MCPPAALKAMADPALSRRNLFKLGLSATAAAATAAIAAKPAAAAPVQPTRFSNVLDLTHILGPDMPLFSDEDPAFSIEPLVTHESAGYYGSVISYWEHVGTHLDAPIHFDPKGLFVDQITPQNLVVPAAVIDITEKARRDPDALVTPDDIYAYERRYGRLPANAAVLLASGWGARIGSTVTHRNADASGVMHFPGFGKEAVDFLIAERNVSGIGVDTLSLDHGPSTTFAVHYTWLSTGKWGLENLGNLEAIPPSGATLFVGAPKIAAGSGGPSRVLAVW